MATSRQQGVSDAVYRYLVKYRNTEVHVDDIADAVNFDRQQVMSAVSHLKNNHNAAIESPRRGWYIFKGSASTGKAVPHKGKAEIIALLDDGRLLVNVEGTVYVAEELEI